MTSHYRYPLLFLVQNKAKQQQLRDEAANAASHRGQPAQQQPLAAQQQQIALEPPLPVEASAPPPLPVEEPPLPAEPVEAGQPPLPMEMEPTAGQLLTA